MHGHVLVALLKAVVLADVVQVVAADDDGAGHFGGDDKAPIRSRKRSSTPGQRHCIIINKYCEK